MTGRSEQMRRVRRRDTKPELLLRRALWARGLRYRLHDQRLPGSPDVVFPGARLAVFVHGCFWHRHEGCRRTTTPKSNVTFWMDKFERNVERDRRKIDELIDLGWNVEVVWECEVVDPDRLGATTERVALRVASGP